MKKRETNIRELCSIGLLTAVICVIAPFSIPMPLGVPMTMQTFAIILAGIILGAKKGALATLLYVLLGVIGLPIFSNFTGGWQSLIGPTGGFILSFPIMAYLIGLGMQYRTKYRWSLWAGLIAGTTMNFLGGVLMFCLITNSSLATGCATCILPFIPGTILKTVLATMLGLHVQKRITTMLNWEES